MTHHPKPEAQNEELRGQIANIILFDFHKRIEDYPRGKTINADAEVEKILSLISAHTESLVLKKKADLIYNLIHHHSIADHAEDALIEQAKKWEAEAAQPSGKGGQTE